MLLRPKYEYDTEVRVIRNIRHDTYGPDSRKGELLVERGTTGFIRHSGVFQQDQIIYQVHFLETNQIVGCRETELIPAEDYWVQNLFEAGDMALLNINLSYESSQIASKFDQVTIMGIDRSDQDNILYRIAINEIDFDIPERALTPVQEVIS